MSPARATPGEQLWRFATPAGIRSQSVVGRDTVYVGSRDSRLCAVNRSTGAVVRTFETDQWIGATPGSRQRVIYVPSFDQHLYVVDARTGTEQWEFCAGDAVVTVANKDQDGEETLGTREGRYLLVTYSVRCDEPLTLVPSNPNAGSNLILPGYSCLRIMSKTSTLVAIAAWGIKVLLFLVSLVMIFSPDYAIYLRVIGVSTIVVATLSFRRSQRWLLAERGITIPNALTAVVLIGAIIIVALTIPSVSDLSVSGDQVTVEGNSVEYEANITNTGDGGVTSADVEVLLNISGTTVSEGTIFSDTDFARGESRSFSIVLTSVDGLDEQTVAALNSGDYTVFLTFDEGTKKYRYQGRNLSINVTQSGQ
jgi:multisubunit Na+/H+ antiporter MnhB subunit